MKKLNNFAVFILTHGRPDNVLTEKMLRNQGYTGKIYFIVDNEDKKVKKYIKNFGKDRVHVFDKKKMADKIDEGNNFNERRTITHARNVSYVVAKKIGVKYFVQLDDDYTSIDHRFIEKGAKDVLRGCSVRSIDELFKAMMEFYENSPFVTIAFAQAGDFIGGAQNPIAVRKYINRKAMNSFFCSVERPLSFVGAMNEDVNTYTTLGSRGVLFGTIPHVAIVQKQTQSQEGGITDMYLLYGTYCKAFTTVMMMPSSVTIKPMGSKNPRIHHAISWKHTVPKILSESVKK